MEEIKNVAEETKSTLTQEEAAKIAKTIDEVATDPDMEGLPDDTKPRKMEYIPPEEAQTEEVKVAVNPNTGIPTIVPENQAEKLEAIDKSIAKLLDIDVSKLYEMPKTVDEIEIPDEFFAKNIKESKELLDIKEEDIAALIPLIKEYRKNPDQNWFDKMPKGVQVEINKACAQLGNVSLAYKKFMAKSFLGEIVSSSGMDRVIIDMQEQLKQAFDTQEFMTMTLDYIQTSTEMKLDNEIKIIDDMLSKDMEEEKRASLLKQKDNFIKLKANIKESYMLTDLIAKLECGKIKVKPKHTDKYKRFCTDFLFKYQKKTPFIINDITICVPSLKRFFNGVFENYQIANFIIAFCMQTMNYDSCNPYDHAYMSYFIDNIRNLLLVKPNQEHTNFSKVLLTNIYKAICLVNHIPEELHKDDIEKIVGDTMAELAVEATRDKTDKNNVPTAEQVEELKEDLAKKAEEQKEKMLEEKRKKLEEKANDHPIQ